MSLARLCVVVVGVLRIVVKKKKNVNPGVALRFD